MIVTIRVDEAALAPEERAALVRALRTALEPFQPRAARATIAILRARGTAPDVRWRVQVAVPLGPAGLVRVAVRGGAVLPCAAEAIARAAASVSRRLGAERRQLLEFLFLASVPPRGRRAPRRAA